MVERKIVLIGAGSLAFTSNLLSEIVLNEDLKGSTLEYVDIDAPYLPQFH
jgi:alpha-galactosidase/6-phospho-beta-glucosidase family protein